MPKTMGSEPVRYIILDNASDPTNAAKNARKLVTEDRVDALMGSNSVPGVADDAGRGRGQDADDHLHPGGAHAGADALDIRRAAADRADDGRDRAAHKAASVHTVAYIGFSDAWGDIVYKAIESHAAASGFKIVTNERYARADTSVTGQMLQHHVGQSGRGGGRRIRHRRRAAARRAGRARLQEGHLSQPWHGERRVHQGRRQGGRRRDGGDRAAGGARGAARRLPDQEGVARLHQALRGGVRRRHAQRLRRLRLRRHADLNAAAPGR